MLGLLLALASLTAVELSTVPEPALDGVQSAVREQLEEARAEAISGGASEWEHLGRLYLLYEFADAASPSFENALLLDPTRWQARYLAGVLHQQAGRFDQAVAAFDGVLERRPDDVTSLLRRGEILLRLRDLEQARGSFERAIALKPRSASAYYGLGRVLDAERRFEAAAAAFERALELQPHADAVLHPLARVKRRLGDVEGAKALLSRAGNSRPIMNDPLLAEITELSVMARTFLLQGDRAQRRGLREEALRFYLRALGLDPRDAGVHYNLGTLYGDLGRLEDAERHFRAAIESDPNRADAYYNLGVGLRSRGRLGDAIQAFRSAVDLGAGDGEARLELAASLYAAGRVDEAQVEFRQVTAGDRDADLTLRLIRYQRAMGDAFSSAESESVLGDATDRWPGDGALRLELARFLSRKGRYEEAAGHFDIVARDARRDARRERAPELELEALRGAAISKAAAGRPEQALADLEAASEMDPKNLALQGALIRVIATSPAPLRDGDRALRLVEGLPSGPETTELRAMALAAAGRFAEAAEEQTGLLAAAAAAGASPSVMARLQESLRRYQAGEVAVFAP